MSTCKTLARPCFTSMQWSPQLHRQARSSFPFCNRRPFCTIRTSPSRLAPLSIPYRDSAIHTQKAPSRPYSLNPGPGAVAIEDAPLETLEVESAAKDTVEGLLSSRKDVARLMKMARRPEACFGGPVAGRWFPYLDRFDAVSGVLSSGEVLRALDPHILQGRKERFRNVVRNRSYSVCLVVEGLSDFGNVSAAFRSADALGIQSVHVVACGSSKRYRDNRHVSKGAEKWLDIELWNSASECFKILKSRGYRIATTHLDTNAVSIYDMDWSYPTAIIVGNESRGISDEALELSDLHCSIPMKGMVDSFNVSVAAGILMHHAVYDRTSRLGCHGDLTSEESQILLAEFSLRHSKSTISIAHEYANQKAASPISEL